MHVGAVLIQRAPRKPGEASLLPTHTRSRRSSGTLPSHATRAAVFGLLLCAVGLLCASIARKSFSSSAAAAADTVRCDCTTDANGVERCACGSAAAVRMGSPTGAAAVRSASDQIPAETHQQAAHGERNHQAPPAEKSRDEVVRRVVSEPSPCSDTASVDCDRMRREGQCDANPAYMNLHCAASCGRCYTYAYDPNLPEEAQPPAYRLPEQVQPQRQPDARHSQQQDTQLRPEAVPRAVRNDDSPAQRARCEAWAERGECSSNPNYMQVKCREACARR